MGLGVTANYISVRAHFSITQGQNKRKAIIEK